MNNRLSPLLKFGMVGLLNTGVDFIVFTALSHWGVSLLIAQCISYACGVMNSYLINRRWTFSQRGRIFSGHLIKFTAINLLTLLITYSLLFVFNRDLDWPLLISKLAATGLSLIVNFAGSRLWVFRESYNGKRSEAA